MSTPMDRLVSKEFRMGKKAGKIIDQLDTGQKAELREAFDLFDKDGDETISCSEFKALFRCFGMRMNDAQVDVIVKKYDVDQSGDIDFEEFCEMMAGYILAPDYDPELVEAYKVFNRNPNSGLDGIDAAELRNVLEKFDYYVTLEEAEAVVEEADWDGDNVLSFPEFCNIMMGKI